MFWLKGCHRCGGDLYQTVDIYGPYIACLQCSRQLSDGEALALLEARAHGEHEGIVIELIPVEAEAAAA